MKEENKLIMMFKRIIGRLKRKADKKGNSDEAKREMCKRAIQGNVCPHVCEICAWNVDWSKN